MVSYKGPSRIAVCLVWVPAGGHVGGVPAGRVQQLAGGVGVLLDEPWQPAGGEAGHVLPDQDLGVAVRAGAHSSTPATAPARSSAVASASSSSPASPRPWTRRIPPSTFTLCGVSPR